MVSLNSSATRYMVSTFRMDSTSSVCARWIAWLIRVMIPWVIDRLPAQTTVIARPLVTDQLNVLR